MGTVVGSVEALDAAGLGEGLPPAAALGDGVGVGGIAYSANTAGRFALSAKVAVVPLNATRSGGKPLVLLPRPWPTGGGVRLP